MKKIITTIALSLTMFISIQLYSQTSNPPTPPGHGVTGDVNGGQSAPVGNGLILLLAMAGAYAGYKGFKEANQEND